MPVLRKKKPEKKDMPKRVHLAPSKIQDKLDTLSKRVEELGGPDNRNKRLRAYRELALLTKALKNPDTMIRDPEEGREKREKDRLRRKAKKILKSKEQRDDKRKEHNKLRRIQCLYCQKCWVTSRAHHG
jgi:hypothetical protein